MNNEMAYTESVIEPGLSDKTFYCFQKFIFDAAGISMSETKKSLISSRLAKRVRALNLSGLDEYYQYITGAVGTHNGELQHCIDLLTTNETYFFRENKHFEFLKKNILPQYVSGQPLHIWSAASSSGEEAYTLSMILADQLGLDADWEVQGTDISTRMILAARQAIYADHRARSVPQNYRFHYLMKGTGRHKGFVSVVPELKKHVTFESYNLINSPRKSITFDVIFCRNVLIYFNAENKRKVIERLCKNLKPKGYLITGHSESLLGAFSKLKSLMPSIYQLMSENVEEVY